MTNTFVTWLLGAAIAGLALLFLLGTPASDSTATPTAAALPANGASTAVESASYWHDVSSAPANVLTASAPVQANASVIRAGASASSVPCSSCATTLTGMVSAIAPALPVAPVTVVPSVGLVGGCGSPSAPCAEAPCGPLVTCGRASCPVCRGSGSGHAVASHIVASHAATSVTTAGQASCGLAACGHAACGHPACGVAACASASPFCDDRPRINRNAPSCVDECSFIQLYSTVSLPVCTSICFAWAATRGEFLDPHSPTPVYFAPSSGFPGGEEVLITLTVTDAQGNEYTDQIKLHINDVN